MSDRTVDTQILSSFITNNKRDIQALLNTASQKIEQLKNSIDTKFNDYTLGHKVIHYLHVLLC